MADDETLEDMKSSLTDLNVNSHRYVDDLESLLYVHLWLAAKKCGTVDEPKLLLSNQQRTGTFGAHTYLEPSRSHSLLQSVRSSLKIPNDYKFGIEHCDWVKMNDCSLPPVVTEGWGDDEAIQMVASSPSHQVIHFAYTFDAWPNDSHRPCGCPGWMPLQAAT